jgi:hypothetical protein
VPLSTGCDEPVDPHGGRPTSRGVKIWPPLLWIPVYIGSELILLGSHHRWWMLAIGLALAVAALGSSLWLALGRVKRPLPSWFYLAIGGVALCYAVAAVAAGRLGAIWAVGALAAGIIPMTAVSLLLATVRCKTIETESGLRDASGDRDDPFPGIGLDDETPLGDTNEHSDLEDDFESEGPAPDRRTGRMRHLG